jgi:flagellar motor switch protein FliN/FliY
MAEEPNNRQDAAGPLDAASTPPSDALTPGETDVTPTPVPAPSSPTAGADHPPATESNLIDQTELDTLVQQLDRDGGTRTATAETPEPASPAPGAARAPSDTDIKAEMAAAIAAHTAAAAGGAAKVSQSPAAGPPQSASVPQEPAVVGSRAAPAASVEVVPMPVPDFGGADHQETLTSIDLLDDVELDVKIELGRAQMYIEDVLRLGEGSVIELDKLAGDPVDIYVNERLVARGEVLVLNESFCVRINDIISSTSEFEDAK